MVAICPTRTVLLLTLLLIPPSLSQSLCPPGQFRSNPTTCTPCPPGTFQDNFGTSCRPCQPGYFNPFPGAQGLDLCLPCPANTFSTSLGATSPSVCRPCPDNTTSLRGSTTCFSCPPGQRQENCPSPDAFFNTGFCLVLDFEGFVQDVLEPTPVCAPCISPRDTGCNLCPLPNTAPVNNSCSLCPPGTGALTFPAARCSRCPRSQFNDGSSALCRPCPPGMTPNSAATRCIPCPPNTAKPTEQGSCQRCPATFNRDSRGATSCRPPDTPCPTNFFRPRGNNICSTCSRLQRYLPRARACRSCPRNRISQGGLDTRCVRCPPGAIATEQGCVCRAGWEFISGGRCQRCAPGTVRPEARIDRPFCRPCVPGRFAPRRGMTECELCPSGRAQVEFGSRRCVPEARACPSGLVLNNDRVECVEIGTNCRPNSVRVDIPLARFPQLSFCNPTECPEGTFQRFINIGGQFPSFLVCETCSTAERLVLGRRCETCPSGRFSAGGLAEDCTGQCGSEESFVRGQCDCVGGVVRNRICERCPPGTIWVREVPDLCLDCPPGTFADQGRLECRKCGVGEFSEARASSCSTCPGRSTTFEEGAASCVIPRSES